VHRGPEPGGPERPAEAVARRVVDSPTNAVARDSFLCVEGRQLFEFWAGK
jgi:hypothetical protein